MGLVCLHDKEQIESFLRSDVYLHIYGIGDLDDLFWPSTTWFGLKTGDRLDAVAMLYFGQPLPTLLALSRQAEPVGELLRAIEHLLPHRFDAHLSPGLEAVLDSTYDLDPHGEHYKMALSKTAPSKIAPSDETAISGHGGSKVVRLQMPQLEEIQAFYRQSYPDNWFDPRMLETGHYFGIREQGRLVSVAGVHVYSPRYRVAALGNIATLPSQRNKGLATQVTARLCRSLAERTDHIGLNVKADNKAAISCYDKLGFEVVASFGVFLAQRRT